LPRRPTMRAAPGLQRPDAAVAFSFDSAKSLAASQIESVAASLPQACSNYESSRRHTRCSPDRWKRNSIEPNVNSPLQFGAEALWLISTTCHGCAHNFSSSISIQPRTESVAESSLTFGAASCRDRCWQETRHRVGNITLLQLPPCSETPRSCRGKALDEKSCATPRY